jgi:hypothetical protein
MHHLAVSYVLQVLPASRAQLRWRDLAGPFWRKLLHPYRPELYYMRGPGPKWREKHLRTTVPLKSPSQKGESYDR